MKTGAYVCADATLAGQCTIKGLNRRHTCLKCVTMVLSMMLTLEMAMIGMTILLESLFKLARRIRAASILLQPRLKEYADSTVFSFLDAAYVVNSAPGIISRVAAFPKGLGLSHDAEIPLADAWPSAFASSHSLSLLSVLMRYHSIDRGRCCFRYNDKFTATDITRLLHDGIIASA
ncbi:hypothetical protein MHU86_23789 [Fragilaria crotonensis]|nr:hypothetical protein MHU86_23789 [Fragilaria crotonensis]